MPVPSPALRRPKPEAGTRSGNGAITLEGVDGRSWGARRYRELVADLVDHLGGEVTAPQEAIVRRAAQLMVWSEAAEAAYARGEDFDIAAYSSTANALRRLLTDLGLERRPRDVTPSLTQYLAGKGSARDGGAA